MKSCLYWLVLAALCWANQPTAWAQPVRVLKGATPGANDAGHQFLLDLKAGIERRAPGRLRMDVFANGLLGQLPATVEGLSMGTIEVVNAAVGFYSGIDPRFSVFDANDAFDNVEHTLRTLNDPLLRERSRAFGNDRDFEALMYYTSGPLVLLSRSPIASLADMKGLLVRVPAGPLPRGPLRLLGANPVTTSLSEVMPALSNRTVDAVVATESVFVTYRAYDLARYLTELPGSWLISAILVRRSVLKALGPELEGIVRDESTKAAMAVPQRNIEKVVRVRKEWLEHGGKIDVLSTADQDRYSVYVKAVVDRLAAESPEWREFHEALLAAAQRQRR